MLIYVNIFFCKCNACLLIQELLKDRGGRDCMVVGLIATCAITTNVVSSNPAQATLYDKVCH